MGKQCHIILKLGNNMGKYAHVIINLGKMMGKYSHSIHSIGEKEKVTLFPLKIPIIVSWESTTSQKYPKYGISCHRFFPTMGNFPIEFPIGNYQKFPVICTSSKN